MKITPLSDHILIQPIEEEKTTKSGIVIPETAEKEHPIKGRVIAVGPGKLNDKGERTTMSVKVGDVVLFKKYGPDEFKLKDDSGKEVEYLIAEEEDILAIIED
jgi:chaperonin GroES